MVAVLAVWIFTRTAFVLVYTKVVKAPDFGGVFADVELYYRWSDSLLDWQVPVGDPMWQYPPGAAAIFVFLRHLGGDSVGGYEATFFVAALAADLLILLALFRLARGDGLLLGAAAWAVVVPCLNLLTYARYDIFVTASAVVALAATVRRPVVAGAAMAIGGLVKVWPVLLLISARPLRGLRPMLTGFVAALAVLGGALTLAFAGGWYGFTNNQSDRGLQIESVGASPLVLARLWDETITVVYVFGAMEFQHPYVRVATVVLPLLTVAGLGFLALWWLVRGRRITWTATLGFDVALLAVLVSVLTSRVFSPQYMLWLVGTAAVCLTRRDTTQRVSAVLILVATGLTSVLFPWFYEHVSADPYWQGTALLLVRNALVLLALGVGLGALTRAAGKAALDSGTDAHTGTGVGRAGAGVPSVGVLPS
ncbi:glycosyltransferase family 87 protein [Micromonospora sp. NPDC049523]|uniref:glycosyltransferase family 87 protein n=1 Tax=Micromonospora sp. NPDC049523 TaxID=3155921 RepID=UPI00343A6DAC